MNDEKKKKLNWAQIIAAIIAAIATIAAALIAANVQAKATAKETAKTQTSVSFKEQLDSDKNELGKLGKQIESLTGKFMIQKGTTSAGSADWPLNVGDGVREYQKTVKFKKKFPKHPKIVIGISGFDSSNIINSLNRLHVEVSDEHITNENFVVVYRTWYDTKIVGVTINWLAYYIPGQD